jgi:hypothetical protein
LEKNQARKAYKKMIFQCKENSKNSVSDKLQQHLVNSNPNKFCRCWKGVFDRAKNFNLEVNDLKNYDDIANCFAKSFKEACTPNNELKHLDFKKLYFANKSAHLGNDDIPFVSVELVSRIVDSIALNKAPGLDGIVIEHLKFAHPSAIIIMTKLFNLFLSLGMVPDNFGLGVTTPIPKYIKGISG